MLATFTLAQAATRDATLQILWAAGVLLAVLAVAVVVGLAVRRILFSEPEKRETTGFTLEHLRRMHQQGELSDEEWQAMREALLTQNQRELADEEVDLPQPSPSSNRTNPGRDIRSSGANNQTDPESAAPPGGQARPDNLKPDDPGKGERPPQPGDDEPPPPRSERDGPEAPPPGPA